MVIFEILVVLSYAIIVGTLVLTAWSLRKFNAGEFKDIMKTLLIAIFFLLVPYTFLVMRDLGSLGLEQSQSLAWPIHGTMLIVALYLLKSSLLLHRFSNVFGFAEAGKTKTGKKK